MECPKGGFGNDSARFVGFTRYLTHLFHTAKIPVRQRIGHGASRENRRQDSADRGQLDEPVEIQHRRGVGSGDGHMMVGQRDEIQLEVARSGPNVHDDDIGLKVF